MMVLGQFVFDTDTVTFDSLKRSRSYSLAKNDVAQGRAQYQFTGVGDDTISIPFKIYESHGFGTRQSVDDLHDMASSGAGFCLIDGSGYIYGVYAISAIDDNSSYIYVDGIPKKVDGTLKLVRVDDDRIQTDKRTDTVQSSEYN